MTIQAGGEPFYSYDSCKQMAIETGSTYFGLQDYQGSNQAQCALSNDLTSTEQYGAASTYTQLPAVWAINTTFGTKANMAWLGPNGVLLVCSDNNPSNVLGTVGNEDPMCVGWGSVQNINATWGANCGAQFRNLNNGGPNNQGYMLGLQNQTMKNYVVGTNSADPSGAQMPDPAYGCAKTFDLSYTCGSVPKSIHVNPEAGGQNVIADCSSEVSYCANIYALQLQDDGNMIIIRLESVGQNPNSYNNGNYLWSSNTSTPNSPNADWAAVNGKYGRNYLLAEESLNTNEWIGSTNGTTRLIMQTDGNLVLYTSVPNIQCNVQSDGNVYGGNSVNAVYQLAEDTSSVSTINNLNKIGYVDENSDLHEYPASMIDYSNEYNQYDGYSSWGYSLPNISMTNASVEQCQTQCNANAECAGFVYEVTSQGCALKSKVFPAINKEPWWDGILYTRKLAVINDKGCPQKLNEISTTQWQNYNQTAQMTPSTKCGQSKNITNQTNVASSIGDTLSNISSQIATTISSIVKPTPVSLTPPEKQFELYNKINESIDGEINNELNNNVNIEGMTNFDLNEMKTISGSIVLQQNYILVFWALLAIGIVIYLLIQLKH